MIAIIHDTVRRDWTAFAVRFRIPCVLKRDLRANPLTPPVGCPVEEWFQHFSYVFCQAFGLQTASWAFLVKLVILTYQECKEQGVFITLRRLYTAIMNYPAKEEEKRYKYRITSKLHAVLLAYPHQFDWEVGFDSLSFVNAGRSVIWERPDEEDLRCFMVLLDAYRLFIYRAHNRHLPHEHAVIVLDEALHILRQHNIEGGLDLASKIVSQARALNLFLLVLTQNPSMLSPVVRSNLGVLVSFRNQSQEIPATRQVMNLTQEQAEEIISFPTGRCALRIPGARLRGPVLVDVDPYPVTEVSEEQLEELSKQAVQPFLDETVPVQEQAIPATQSRYDPTGLSRDAITCLHAIYERCELIDTRCKDLGWTKSHEHSQRRRLKDLGLIAQAGSCGNKRAVWVPTARTEPIAKKNGWKRDTYKSGPVHQAACLAIKRSILRSIAKHVRLYDKGLAALLGGRQPDIAARFQGGDFLLIQILHANDVDREGQVLTELANLELGHVRFVVAVCLNREKRMALERYLVKQCDGAIPTNLVLLDIELILRDSGYDWSWVLEQAK